MTILVELLLASAKHFDDERYPLVVYFFLLDQVAEAKSPEALGSALAHLLAWKDAKIRKDPNGPFQTHRPTDSYRVSTPRPNTLCDRHVDILKSDAFFAWAQRVRTTQSFDAELLADLRAFGLWMEGATVLPAFLLHCLRPPIFPIVDRYGLTAYNLFQTTPALRADPSRITANAYANYHDWWLRVVAEAGLRPLAAELNQLKAIDSGIWVLGRSIAARANDVLESDDAEETQASLAERRCSPPALSPAARGTQSREFKMRAIACWTNGDTQANAIARAATELGIALKPSYRVYPGSHFDRWRKQGLWTRPA